MGRCGIITTSLLIKPLLALASTNWMMVCRVFGMANKS